LALWRIPGLAKFNTSWYLARRSGAARLPDEDSCECTGLASSGCIFASKYWRSTFLRNCDSFQSLALQEMGNVIWVLAMTSFIMLAA